MGPGCSFVWEETAQTECITLAERKIVVFASLGFSNIINEVMYEWLKVAFLKLDIQAVIIDKNTSDKSLEELISSSDIVIKDITRHKGDKCVEAEISQRLNKPILFTFEEGHDTEFNADDKQCYNWMDAAQFIDELTNKMQSINLKVHI